MDPEEEQARRRRAVEEARDLLRDLNAADELRAAMPRAMPETTLTQSCGDLPLLSSARSQRWRREAEEAEARHAAAEAERKQKEARIIRQRQQAAERAASVELTEAWTDAIGQIIAEERQAMRDHVAEQLGLLRAELTVRREAERGQILDLPALPLRRRGNAA